MKHILFITLIIFIGLRAQSQDSLTTAVLEKLSYSFTIEDGKIIGDGGKFLADNIHASQFTMMGEYHGSYQISLLTEALIPHLEEAGYGTFIAEIGPYSGEILSELSKDPSLAKENLRKLNAQYNYEESEYTAIPFFTSEVDANFLHAINKAKMDIVGIDQEFVYAYPMLINEMYEQIYHNEKPSFATKHQQMKDTIDFYIKMVENGDGKLDLLIRDSKFTQGFFQEIEHFGDNESIIEALNKSIKIYALNSSRQWYLNNKTRVRYMKENLRKGLSDKHFNFTKDKAFAKMGAYHLSKGFNPMGFYDIGNTLNELAEFNGNQTFSFTFLNRYFTEDGITGDMMDEESTPALANLIRMGKKDEWTIIDLRPLIKGTEFYPRQYWLTPAEAEYIKHYDVVIIPPVDWYSETMK